MHHISRVSSYLVLQLVSAGFYCIEPKHLDATAIIAGKDGQGFIVLLHDSQPTAPATLPDELAFLRLPVQLVKVAVADNPKQGRPMLTATMDAALKAQLPIGEPGEFGILVKARQTEA